MKILRLLLFILGIFALAGMVVCVVRSDYRGFGSGVTTVVTIWAGYFLVTYILKGRDRSPRRGRLATGPVCMTCGKRTEGRDSLMASQSNAVQAGLIQSAADMEKHQGYLCQSCGNVYCKTCLSRHDASLQSGVACPGCGGAFGYLP